MHTSEKYFTNNLSTFHFDLLYSIPLGIFLKKLLIIMHQKDFIT